HRLESRVWENRTDGSVGGEGTTLPDPYRKLLFDEEHEAMNETALVQKVWNYAHVLRDQGVPYQAYISQISYLLFLKMDDERAGLVASGLIRGESSAIPEDCRWPVLRDLQGEELTRRYSAILEILSCHSGIVGTTFLKAQNE